MNQNTAFDILRRLDTSTKINLLAAEYKAKNLSVVEMRTLLTILIATPQEKILILDQLRIALVSGSIPGAEVAAFLEEIKDSEIPLSTTQSNPLRRFSRSFEDMPTPKPLEETTKSKAVDGDKMGAQTGFYGTSPRALREQAMYNARPKNILVADDDKRILMLNTMRLRKEGFNVIECDRGDTAWEKLQRQEVDGCVLDMKMPGLHGLEVLANMSASSMKIPVVICTAYEGLDEEFVVVTYPKIQYLVKPVMPDQIIAALRGLGISK